MHSAYHGNFRIILNPTEFKCEYIGRVFNTISTASYEDRVYVLKHARDCISLVSQRMHYSFSIPHMMVRKQIEQLVDYELVVSEPIARLRELNNAFFLLYNYFTQPEWVSLRYSFNSIGFICTVVHSDFGDPYLRQLNNSYELRKALHGKLLLINPYYSDISYITLLNQFHLLQLFVNSYRDADMLEVEAEVFKHTVSAARFVTPLDDMFALLEGDWSEVYGVDDVYDVNEVDDVYEVVDVNAVEATDFLDDLASVWSIDDLLSVEAIVAACDAEDADDAASAVSSKGAEGSEGSEGTEARTSADLYSVGFIYEHNAFSSTDLYFLCGYRMQEVHASMCALFEVSASHLVLLQYTYLLTLAVFVFASSLLIILLYNTSVYHSTYNEHC